ncbi:uncharacterized protein LOC106866491 [Brachypodium distachyon]|uniref:Uncharacterized protein n=1 Tax=Brachypodium distachyon TaxID=15368 RepID=I1HWP7_BRADI|nr:uncharacterized protein LOC106866491 [Brachypodium distachyon]KQJ93055.1 hypothetical protein BRADI_3g02480v3 [Brachypodium distachyon]|eukprot:XP_014756234.1 uncharacterized protein LOC106866491 [Brachypodium distachyon]
MEGGDDGGIRVDGDSGIGLIGVDGVGIGVIGGDVGIDGGGGGGFSWTFAASLLAFLTFNCGMAVWTSRKDASIVAFVATSYLDLLLLFCCLWFYNRAAPGSPRRSRLKVSVWTLTTLLTFSYCYMVLGTAAGLTLQVALLVWLIPAATGVGASYAFFDDCRNNEQPLDRGIMLAPPV